MAYAEDDAPIFFGRDGDRQSITANLHAARLTIVYGASGIGKSSVLQAGVAHHLHQQVGRAVVVFDNWQNDPLPELKRLIAEETGRIAEQTAVTNDDLPLDQFIEERMKGVRKPLVLVLDQFEGYLLYHPFDEGPNSFAVEFARAVNREECPVRFVVAIREDMLARLDRFEARIPGLFDNYLRLGHLDHHGAREAITKPLEVYNRGLAPEQQVNIEPKLVEDLIEQVRRGRVFFGQEGRGRVVSREQERLNGHPVQVETPYLQLVLTRLWNEETGQGSRVLRTSTLEALGGVENIVRTHLDSAMIVLKPEQQEVAARIFHFLVTPSGQKIAYVPADLATYAEVPERHVQTVAGRLAEQDLRVLRPVAASSTENGEPSYEIYHDVLAPAILDWRTRYLSGSTSSRKWNILQVAALVAALSIEFLPSPPAAILVVSRSVLLFGTAIVILNQAYRLFTRYGRLTISRIPAAMYGGINLGTPLALLLTLLWYVSTDWQQILSFSRLQVIMLVPLASVSSSLFIGYYVITQTLTFTIGVTTFFVMLGMSRLTGRISKRYDLGFFGVYVVVCLVVIVAAISILSGVLPTWIGPQ